MTNREMMEIAMRQIGVDVLPEYRRQGIACALTSALAHRYAAGIPQAGSAKSTEPAA